MLTFTSAAWSTGGRLLELNDQFADAPIPGSLVRNCTRLLEPQSLGASIVLLPISANHQGFYSARKRYTRFRPQPWNSLCGFILHSAIVTLFSALTAWDMRCAFQACCTQWGLRVSINEEQVVTADWFCEGMASTSWSRAQYAVFAIGRHL
jgi:hypothetical protein